jgi:hypothetical protein
VAPKLWPVSALSCRGSARAWAEASLALAADGCADIAVDLAGSARLMREGAALACPPFGWALLAGTLPLPAAAGTGSELGAERSVRAARSAAKIELTRPKMFAVGTGSGTEGGLDATAAVERAAAPPANADLEASAPGDAAELATGAPALDDPKPGANDAADPDGEGALTDGGREDNGGADLAADGGEVRPARASGAVEIVSAVMPSAASFWTTDTINSLLPVSSFTNFTPMPVGPCSFASRRSHTTLATPRTLPPSPSASHSSFRSVPAAAGFDDRMNIPPADRSQQASWTNSKVVGLR